MLRMQRCTIAVTLLALAVSGCSTATVNPNLRDPQTTKASLPRIDATANIDAFISTALTVEQRSIIRTFMLNLPPSEWHNVILLQDGKVYANRPGLIAQTHLAQYVSGSGNLYKEQNGSVTTDPDTIATRGVSPSTCGPDPSWTGPMMDQTGPYRRVSSDPALSRSFVVTGDVTLPSITPPNTVIESDEGVYVYSGAYACISGTNGFTQGADAGLEYASGQAQPGYYLFFTVAGQYRAYQTDAYLPNQTAAMRFDTFQDTSGKVYIGSHATGCRQSGKCDEVCIYSAHDLNSSFWNTAGNGMVVSA